ncbi:MAG: SUMF1/EgtB/PvdO family nonheme iron enzyme [Candidatus Lernaella stagnicola]|nr:SUMF1/EgtB/PvdO family nonheme iron enzyme [Candidatus Lernaella stagnicola]
MGDEKKYRVFISSTFIDNAERRKTVDDAIVSAGMLPVGMEWFTASTRPTVEFCTQMAAECDLLVGIIAWRYGWIPKGSKVSITEMEYDAAKEAGKDRLMFVLDPSLPFTQKEFDQDKDKWVKQQKLETFKARFSEDQMPAHFNETTLGTRVLAALTDWRLQEEAGDSGPAKLKKPESACKTNPAVDDDIRLYCAKVESLHSHLPVAGFVTHLKVPIDIDDIYVPLTATVDLRGFGEGAFYSAKHAEECLRGCEDRQLEIALPEAFRQSERRKRKGVVILGDPGSGKTTHLKRLLLWCLRKGTADLGLPADMLPVFLPLRELRDLNHGLDAFIQSQFEGKHLGVPAGFGERMIRRGNLLLLFDGLDEVADLAQREQVSKWIVDAVRELPTCRFVVTSRYAGYSETVRLSEDFLEMHIRPLNADQAARFVHNWYRAVEVQQAKDPVQGESIARTKAEDLIDRLSQPDFRARRVFELTRNPLLLTNLCLVHRQRGAMPKKRSRLYEECVDVLLEYWRAAKGLKIGVDAREGRRVLQPAALWLHEKEGRTYATAEELEPVLYPALKKVGWEGGTANDFLSTIRDQSGLLVGWDTEHYGFMHLGFQEYLAAREIRSQAFSNPEVIKELASHFGESWWEEVALLLLALEDPSLFEPFMREVVKLPAFSDNINMVEMCLDDAAEISTAPFRELLVKAAGKDRGLWERQFTALRILYRLDPQAVETLAGKLRGHPDDRIRNWFKLKKEEAAKRATQKVIHTEPGGVELVHIPGGSFMMGRSEDDEVRRWSDELPRHSVTLNEFYLGRYPVTNEEYGRFLTDNPKSKEPEFWADRKWNQPTQPVVGVTWDDAKAFAEWAGGRLPSEAEWEFACRTGTTGSRYGTLDEIAWYKGNSNGQLQPVGLKKPNAFGLYDTLGNVWEWCEDDWHENYDGAPDNGSTWVKQKRGESARVVRGGSWGDLAVYVRASIRGGGNPDYRGSNVGFRISRDC